MSDGFPNTIKEGVPWSADIEPMGPHPQGMDTYYYGHRRVSQDGPVTMADDASPLISQDEGTDLYAGLPDIAVPKHRVP